MSRTGLQKSRNRLVKAQAVRATRPEKPSSSTTLALSSGIANSTYLGTRQFICSFISSLVEMVQCQVNPSKKWDVWLSEDSTSEGMETLEGVSTVERRRETF